MDDDLVFKPEWADYMNKYSLFSLEQQECESECPFKAILDLVM